MTKEEIVELQKSAALGDANSQYQLAMMHIYGDGVDEDNALAFELLKKATVQNHVEATYNLGICYHYGYGTEEDLKTAFDLYQKSADLGYGKGMELVGRFYSQGIYIPCDLEKAKYWLGKAMNSDDIDAIDEAKKELNRVTKRCNLPTNE